MITFEEFERFSRDYNVIPLIRSTLADLVTPVTAYLGLHDTGHPSFLFESVETDEKIGRFSFVGVDPLLTLHTRGQGVDIVRKGERTHEASNILDVLARYAGTFRQAPVAGAEGFLGGFVGYLGYPAVAHLERLQLRPQLPDDEDESVFGLFGSILRFDHQRQMVTIVHNAILEGGKSLREIYDEAKNVVDTLELRLRRSVVVPQNFACELSENGDASDREGYCAAVTRIKKYIVDGDIFQAVLSRRMRMPYTGDLFPVYRALRIINPSPYLFYVDFGETKLAGSSPEVLVRVLNGQVQVLPIAGTRPRGRSVVEDDELAAGLLEDRKELAEHLMLVDLGRNDVGRISRFGSVTVPVFKRIERFSHVMHIVSEVRGTLREGLSSLDALRACFPAGTVSGAPKVRAMEIINELEPVSRGAYAGAVGYLGFNGSLDTCIAIRTIVAHRGQLSIQVGAGIVADSVPEREYQETVNKSQALLDAVRAASGGLKNFES